MFDFLKNKPEENKETTDRSQYATAPGTEIRFDPELIEHLKSDHERLLEAHREIKSAFDAGNFSLVTDLLDEFRAALQGHLLTESVRLYIYLEHQLARDEFNYDLMRGFRREMDSIGKTVMNFLKKYEAIGVDQELAAAFEKDVDTLGEVLAKRIQREEEVLYPLYLPHY